MAATVPVRLSVIVFFAAFAAAGRCRRCCGRWAFPIWSGRCGPGMRVARGSRLPCVFKAIDFSS